MPRNEGGAATQGDASREAIREQSERLIARAKAEGFFWPDDSPILADLAKMVSNGGAEHQVFKVGEPGHEIIIRATASRSRMAGVTIPARASTCNRSPRTVSRTPDLATSASKAAAVITRKSPRRRLHPRQSRQSRQTQNLAQLARLWRDCAP